MRHGPHHGDRGSTRPDGDRGLRPRHRETEYKGRQAGTFGDIGCFSFYSTKNVATGEGCMIVARDEALTARAKVLALHGMSKDARHRFSDSGYRHYQVVDVGFKYNMMDLQAAIGLHQLARADASWLKRQAIWRKYTVAFAELPVELPAPSEQDTRHAYHLFTAMVAPQRAGGTRDEALALMHRSGIGVGVHYLSLPEHPVYQQRFGWRPEQWPNAMRIGQQTISLPLSPKLTDSDVDCVIDAYRSVFQDLTRLAETP